MTKPDDENLRTLTPHKLYHIPSGDLSFVVDGTQFRVHKYFFERESSYFNAVKLSTPTSPGSPLQGSSDGHAIIIEDATPDEFARFLWVFYNPQYSLYEATVDDWATILRLANLWGFPEVKNFAIRELEKQDMLDVRRIKLYHDNDVDRSYLIPRYAALCARPEPLTYNEGLDLGMETAMRIAQGREEVRASRTASGGRSPLSPTVSGSDLFAAIRELFQISASAPQPGPAAPAPAPAPMTGASQTKPQPTVTITQPAAKQAPAASPAKTAAKSGVKKPAQQGGTKKNGKVTEPTPTTTPVVEKETKQTQETSAAAEEPAAPAGETQKVDGTATETTMTKAPDSTTATGRPLVDLTDMSSAAGTASSGVFGTFASTLGLTPSLFGMSDDAYANAKPDSIA